MPCLAYSILDKSQILLLYSTIDFNKDSVSYRLLHLIHTDVKFLNVSHVNFFRLTIFVSQARCDPIFLWFSSFLPPSRIYPILFLFILRLNFLCLDFHTYIFVVRKKEKFKCKGWGNSLRWLKIKCLA